MLRDSSLFLSTSVVTHLMLRDSSPLRVELLDTRTRKVPSGHPSNCLWATPLSISPTNLQHTHIAVSFLGSVSLYSDSSLWDTRTKKVSSGHLSNCLCATPLSISPTNLQHTQCRQSSWVCVSLV